MFLCTEFHNIYCHLLWKAVNVVLCESCFSWNPATVIIKRLFVEFTIYSCWVSSLGSILCGCKTNLWAVYFPWLWVWGNTIIYIEIQSWTVTVIGFYFWSMYDRKYVKKNWKRWICIIACSSSANGSKNV